MSYNNYNRGYAEPTMTSADYMTRTYRWMALGLLVTFAAAFVTATTPLFYVVNSLYLLFTIAELALVFVLSARVQNMSVGAARGVFLGYALLNGMVLSYYFIVFSVGTLVMAFLATAVYFGLMAVYGTSLNRMGLDSLPQAARESISVAHELGLSPSILERVDVAFSHGVIASSVAAALAAAVMAGFVSRYVREDS